MGRRGSHFLLTIALFGVLVAVMPTRANAVTDAFWTQSGSGFYTNANRWSTAPNVPMNGVPTEDDTYHVHFDTGTSFAYDVDAQSLQMSLDQMTLEDNVRLRQLGGNVAIGQLNINAGSYLLTEDAILRDVIVTADGGRLEIEDGHLYNATVRGTVDIVPGTPTEQGQRLSRVVLDEGVINVRDQVILADSIQGRGTIYLEMGFEANEPTTIGPDIKVIVPADASVLTRPREALLFEGEMEVLGSLSILSTSGFENRGVITIREGGSFGVTRYRQADNPVSNRWVIETGGILRTSSDISFGPGTDTTLSFRSAQDGPLIRGRQFTRNGVLRLQSSGSYMPRTDQVMMLFQSDQPILGEFSEIETGHLNPKFAWDTSQLLTTSELGFTGPDISRIAYTQFAEPALDDISYHPTRDAKELGFITYYETNEGAWPGIGVNEFTGERTLSYQSVTSETAFDRVPLVEYAMAAVDIELSVSDTGFEDNDPDYIQFYLFRDDETTPTLYYYYDLINGELPLEKTSVSINIPTDWSSVTLQVGTRTNSTSGAERINLHSVSFVGYGYDDAMYVAGDFAVDGDLTSADLNKLQVAIDRSTYVAAMDLDADGRMGINDRVHWIETTWGSYVGDSNWDGQFSSSDLVTVFQAGEYEDDLVANSRWETGDWNGDREFNSSDLVTAFQRGGYEQGSRSAAMAVPEPSYSWLVVVPLALGWRRDLV